jgi:hypothetical protein
MGPVDKRQLTQVCRALERLGIEHIPAYSPQARGRSERLNRTFQDRRWLYKPGAAQCSIDDQNSNRR